MTKDMSAPSKEERSYYDESMDNPKVARAVAEEWQREWNHLADENERLRQNLEIAEQSRDAWKADRERVVEENATLRAEQQRPMPWTEDELKALIKEAVESDPNGKCLHCGGTFPKTDLYHWRDCLRHTANIEIATLRAERAECLAMLDCLDLGSEDVDRACLPNEDGSCGWLPEYGTCVEHKRQDMIAKLRGQQP